MQLLRTEERFVSTEAGGVVLGPFSLAKQGDAPKRSFRCLILNAGKDTEDSDITVKAQEAETVDGSYADVGAGSVEIKVRAQEVYSFYVKGKSAYWRLYSTGAGVAVFQILDNEEFDSVMDVG